MKTEDLNVPEILPLWVGLTSGAAFPPALPREEALRRARELLGVLRKGMLSERRIEADEDVKHVLYALCELLREPGRDGQLLLDDANAVYHFIESVHWPDDVLEEKSELLLECAEIGWGAIGLSVAEITRRRLAAPLGEMNDFRADPFPNTDVLAVLLKLLVNERETQPQGVFEEAASLHKWLRNSGTAVGLFDEREYLLGETACIAAVSARLLGARDEAESWLDLAEAGYRHTVNPAPLLANVAYQRLSVRYESRRFGQLLELLPSLIESFKKLGMMRERAKARFLEAITLKECDRNAESLQVLAEIRLDSAGGDRALLGQVLIEIGEQHGLEGRYQDALALYQQALPMLREGGRPMALPHLKSVIGETLAANGQPGSAVGAFREAIQEFEQLGLKPNACRIRLVLADTLLRLDRPREAEWEILTALPTIEEQKMVPEGFAAVALLKESVRRRKTDPNALRELREHLQASK